MHNNLQKPDILTVIEREGGVFKQRGRDFWGLCPFHSEKTPSSKVSIEKQTFHCFGCGVHHGDVISFVMALHGLSFRDALKYLNIEKGAPPKIDPQKARQRDLLKAYRAWLKSFYRDLCGQERALHALRTRSRDRPFEDEKTAWDYAELISALPRIEAYADILLSGSEEAKLNLFYEVNQIDERKRPD
jgi:DNA primase